MLIAQVSLVILVITTIIFVYNRKEFFSNNGILEKSTDAFPDCGRCVRYFDTVICKCNKSSDPSSSAFLYPTDLTPDINIADISIRNK